MTAAGAAADVVCRDFKTLLCVTGKKLRMMEPSLTERVTEGADTQNQRIDREIDSICFLLH